MSNIQITENASGKYSPEWFYSESQTPEWISFAHKADELRENFINLFGIERLKSLSGKDLLTSLFYNDEGTKTNLCYILEMDKDIREVFGSISGGAAYKFGLFYHKKNQSWTCGSPLKPVLLTEAEAIQKADEMRNDLVEGAEIISSFGPLDSEEDYEQLYKQLEHIPGINMVWRMKYYQMLFPALFAPFYGQDIQLRVLHFLNQKPSDIPFIRMGQISLYARKCNVPGVVFAHIYGKNVGYTNETNDSDTNTLSDKKHKTHYWMYTVFDDKSWNECQQKGIMVLGMDDIGDYSQFASKEALRQELIDVYDSSTSRKNQALMAWNFANTVSVNDVIFAKRSNTLVGKGIVTGNYVFDDLRQEYKNVRAVKWLQVGEWEHPGKSFLFYFETEHVFFANTFFETQKKTRNFLLIFSCFYILFFFFLILFFPKTLLRNTKNPLLSSYISNIYSSLTSTSFFAIKIYQYDTPILNNLTPFKPVIIPIVTQ